MKKKIDWEVVGVVLFIFTLFPFVWFYRELIQQTMRSAEITEKTADAEASGGSRTSAAAARWGLAAAKPFLLCWSGHPPSSLPLK
jgi:hypothetical protein